MFRRERPTFRELEASGTVAAIAAKSSGFDPAAMSHRESRIQREFVQQVTFSRSSWRSWPSRARKPRL